MHQEVQEGTGQGSPFFSIQDIMTERDLRVQYIRHVVAACGGNKTRAAKVLGIDRRSLYRRLGSRT